MLLILGWAWTEMYPLRDEPGKLIEQFGKATNKDADFDKVFQAAYANFDPNDKNSNEFGTLYEAVEASGLVLTNYNFPKMTFRGQVPDNRLILQKLQKQVAGQIQLGLDLKGGSSFLVAMDTNKLENTAASGALAQAVEVLRRRVDTIGVAEPDIRPLGANKIMIQLPGLSEADQAKAKKLVTEAAFLEFALVHENSDRLIADELTPDGYKKYAYTSKDAQGDKFTRDVLVEIENKYGLKGEHITSAYPSRDPLTQSPMILFGFNSEGASAMGQLTNEKNIGRRMAIILDGKLLSAPVLLERITSHAQITGDFTQEEATTICNGLLNPLKAPLMIKERYNDSKLSLGAALLRIAIIRNYTEIIELLIKQRPKVINAMGKNKETALDFAIRYNKVKIADILRQNGGNANTVLK